MAEYIEREAVIKIAERYGLKNGSALGRHSGIADCIAEAIPRIPAADVAPVRHGRWNADETCPFCGKKSTEGLDAEKWDYWFPAFCPNCWCSMDGKEETE